LLPLLGTVLGFVFTILKIALILGAILFVVWVLKKKGGAEKKDEGLSADAG
jgi:flagellar biogenesis protein FliO